jgi:hypothetical protein
MAPQLTGIDDPFARTRCKFRLSDLQCHNGPSDFELAKVYSSLRAVLTLLPWQRMHTVRARRGISGEVGWVRQRGEVFRLSLPTPFGREKEVAMSRPA